MNLFRILLCLFSLSLFVKNTTGQGLYQKSWVVDVSAGAPLLVKDDATPLQARLSGGYEIQFSEPEILGLAFRFGYALSRGFANIPSVIDPAIKTDDLLYKYNGNSLFVGISPMIIFEQFDSNFDRVFLESEFGLASHNVDINIYEPNSMHQNSWVHFKGYFALKAGFRLAWNQEGYFRAMSIWGSLHNQSPVNAIEKTIPKNWPYKFKEDLKSQWQVGVSVYI